MALLAATAGTTSAQDSHYSTNLYGDRSTLLGGAVIASVDDASAAYYNPGALADVAAGDVFLGTKIFDFTRISISGTGDKDYEIGTDDLGKAPSFIGGMIPIQLEQHRFAYSLFKRASFKLRLTETAVDEFGIGLNDVSSSRLEVDLDTSLNDDWLGLSWACGASSKTMVGVSTFFSYRSHRYRSLRSAEFYKADGRLRTTILTRQYSYSYLSVLWKLGLKHQMSERLDVGFSLTTPGVNFGPQTFSDGKAGLSASLTEGQTSSGDSTEAAFVSDYQTKLEATFRSPFGFGAGASYRFAARTVHLSIEYFGAVDEYKVLDPDEFIAQSTGDTLVHPVTGGRETVLNLGIGLEEHFGEHVQGFLGFNTDFSYAPVEDEASVYFTKWSLYHLTGGSQFAFGNAQVTLGLGYSFGGEDSDRLLTIDDVAGEEETFVDGDVKAKVKFDRLKIIVGFGIRT